MPMLEPVTIATLCSRSTALSYEASKLPVTFIFVTSDGLDNKIFVDQCQNFQLSNYHYALPEAAVFSEQPA